METELLTFVIVGVLLAFLLAFVIGGNNASCVGGSLEKAKVLNSRQTFLLICVFELVGCALYSTQVSNTIHSGIVSSEFQKSDDILFSLVMISGSLGSLLFVLCLVFLKIPVSSTHCLYVGIASSAVLAKGWNAVKWINLLPTFMFWAILPFFSALIAYITLWLLRLHFINRADPFGLHSILRYLHIVSGIVAWVFFSVCLFNPLSNTPWLVDEWKVSGPLLISLVCAIAFAALTRYLIVPLATPSSWDLSTDLASQPSDNIRMRQHQFARDIIKQTHRNSPSQPNKDEESGISVSNPAFDGGDQDITDLRRRAASDPPESDVELGEKRVDEYDLRPSHKGHEEEDHDESGSVAISTVGLTQNLDDIAFDNFDESDGPSTELEDVPEPEATKSDVNDSPKVTKYPITLNGIFSVMLVILSAGVAISHGSNDLPNVIAPVSAIYDLYVWSVSGGHYDATVPVNAWMTIIGALGLGLGVLFFHKKVHSTMDKVLSLTPASACAMQFSVLFTMMIATAAGLGVSTSQILIGAMAGTSWADSKETLSWSRIRKMCLAWFLTFVFSTWMSLAGLAFLKAVVGVE